MKRHQHQWQHPSKQITDIKDNVRSKKMGYLKYNVDTDVNVIYNNDFIADTTAMIK